MLQVVPYLSADITDHEHAALDLSRMMIVGVDDRSNIGYQCRIHTYNISDDNPTKPLNGK